MILFGSHGANNRKPQTIDEYLACVNVRSSRRPSRASANDPGRRAKRGGMYQLRNSRVPSEWAPACWVRAWSNHCSFYPMSSKTLKKFRNELRNFQTSKGTLRFSPDNPMPVALVKKLVKARIAENNARANKNRRKP
jgi:Uncharacterized conserved protein